jgi:hypothetical protein
MSRAPLIDLAVTYFRRRGFKVEKNVTLEGFSGLPRKFDLTIQKGNEKRLIWIKDWKRTVGVNMIINVDMAAADVGLSNPIIISDKFSGHAKAYANRRNVTLMIAREIRITNY